VLAAALSASSETLVETDETPPLPFDKDRHYHYGQYVLGPQLGLFALRKLPRVAVHELSLTQYLLPAAEAGGPVREGFEQGVVDLCRDPRSYPLVALGG
jgi:hypothetical protein